MKKKHILFGAVATTVLVTAATVGGLMSQASSVESDPTVIKCNGSSVSVTGDGVEVNGTTITINTAGYYSISGTLSDGQLIIDADHDNDEIDLALNGVSITCKNNAPFYVKSANKTRVTVNDNTTNSFIDTSNYVLASGEDEPNAAMYAQDDLIIKGNGTLNVTGNYKHGINGKDDLKIKGGNINVTSVNDGIKGKDSLEITGGTITVDSKDDAIKAYNDEEDGYLTISNADITVSASDDGIKAESYVTIGENANVNIKNSYEGIEATVINLDAGSTVVNASDDGINASDGTGGNSMRASDTAVINITGGTHKVISQGDGVDSNGAINMSGGTVYIDGPTDNGNGALDHNGDFALTGGTLVAAGSSGMVELPTSNVTTQCVVSLTYSSTQSANTAVTLKDSSNNTIISYTPSKNYQNVVISSPNLKTGSTYSIYSGNSTTAVQTFTISSVITSLGSSSNGQNTGTNSQTNTGTTTGTGNNSRSGFSGNNRR